MIKYNPVKLGHTPGPWLVTVDPDGSGDDYCIGTVTGKVDQVAVCSKRDAGLIAAAPDLKEALEDCIEALEEGLDAAQVLSTLGDKRPGLICRALSKAREALLKINGVGRE